MFARSQWPQVTKNVPETVAQLPASTDEEIALQTASGLLPATKVIGTLWRLLWMMMMAGLRKSALELTLEEQG